MIYRPFQWWGLTEMFITKYTTCHANWFDENPAFTDRPSVKVGEKRTICTLKGHHIFLS